MPTFHRAVFAFVMLVSLGLTFARAQEASALANTLERTQKTFRRQTDLVSTSMRRLYLERLQGLELKAAKAGHYEAAQAYQEEGDRIRTQLGPKAKAPLRLILLPGEATLSRDLTLTNRLTQTLSGWKPGSTAAWKLPAIPQGGYRVEIVHRKNSRPVSFKLAASHYHVSGSLAEAAGENKDAQSSLGDLRIIRDSPTLTLTLEDDDLSSGLTEIKHIILISHAP